MIDSATGQAVRERKNALLLFSKLPEVGKVKTRLTTLKDGVFEPEVASGLYHCMLFDVVEIMSAALADLEAREPVVAAAGEAVRDTYELVISTAPASNVPSMERLFYDAGEWPHELVFIADEGADFDEHYNHAFQQCWDRGADCILSMGADMPALTKSDIKFGFDQLHRVWDMPHGGIVIAPDQEMGVSVVGWTRNTEFTHDGVYYNRSGLTVLPAYIHKAAEQELPVLWLPPIPDVDTIRDLWHTITLVEALNYCANFDDICPPWRTQNALREMGWDQVVVPPNDLFDPRDEIDK